MQSSKNKRIKILELLSTTTVGGAENTARAICARSNKKLFDIKVVSINGATSPEWPKSVRYQTLNKRKRFSIGTVIKLRRLIIQQKPDIIHTHTLFPLLYLLAAWPYKCSAINLHTVQNDLRYYQGWFWRLVFPLFRIYPINLSHKLNPFLQNKDTSFVIPNSVDLARFKAPSRSHKFKKRILHIGRFDTQKNHNLLLRFFAQLLKHDPEYHLTMIGWGTLEKSVRKQIDKLKLEGNVELITKRIDPIEHFRKNDFFVLTSKWEGMPLVILEAMASGMVVFSTRVGATEELIQNQENGFLFSNQDHVQMAEEFIENISETNLSRVSSNAIKNAESYSEDLMLAKYEQVFLRLQRKKKRVGILVGGRPQLIKAAPLISAIKKSDKLEWFLIDSGQHYSKELSAQFYKELKIEQPKYKIKPEHSSPEAQAATIHSGIEKVLQTEKPDYLITFGDMNTTLAGAMAAKKNRIRLVHIEAGIRSGNMAMAEELNRIATDHFADILFAPDHTAVANLRREGIVTDHSKRKVVINSGDLMLENLTHNNITNIKSTDIDLLTIHRAENTNSLQTLLGLISFVVNNSASQKIIFPIHPRTKKALQGKKLNPKVTLVEPLSHKEIIRLAQQSNLIFTDSGGLLKEACWLGKPCVILRKETEWPNLIRQKRAVLADKFRTNFKFKPRVEKLKKIPSEIIVNYIANEKTI